MPPEKLRIFLSSPADVRQERERAELVIEQLGGEFAQRVRFETIRWEDRFYSAHRTFQAQIPEAAECDIVIAIFWKRLGSPLVADFPLMANGEPYPSGTVYEVLTALDMRDGGAPRPDVYVFRKTAPPVFSEAELDTGKEQLQRVRDFVGELDRKGRGSQQFATTDEFAQQIDQLIRQWVAANLVDLAGPLWPRENQSPFRGLAPFDAKHAEVFFGRTRRSLRAIANLKEAARRGAPFLMIIGPSGAGKSSLMRAGVAPRLTVPGVVSEVDAWRVAVMHPGGAETPFDALARALLVTGAPAAGDDPGGFGPALPELAQLYKEPGSLARLLRADPTPAAELVVAKLDGLIGENHARAGFGRAVRTDLLLLVDQLEELFAETATAEQRDAFAELLHGLVRTRRVWIVATLRADLMAELILARPLFALKDAGSDYNLGPPDESELTEIVEKSAEAAGLVYGTDPATGERLDERLLRDAVGGDSLPLLEFTLNSLYEQRQIIDGETRLTVEAYTAMGGLDGAINSAAEQAMATVGETDQAALARLLISLAVPVRDRDEAGAAGNLRTSRMVPFAEACPDDGARRLAAALIDARILRAFDARPDGDLRPERPAQPAAAGPQVIASLRIAHDRVLRSWTRAREMIDALGDFFRVRADIQDQRRKWQAGGGRPDGLITARLQLLEAERTARTYGHLLSPEDRDFVAASSRRARREQRMKAAAIGAVICAAMLALAAGVMAIFAERDAQANYQAEVQTVDSFTGDVLLSLREHNIGIDIVKRVLSAVETTVQQLEGLRHDDPHFDQVHARMLFEFSKTYQFAKDNAQALKYADESLQLRQKLAAGGDPDAQWVLAQSLELVGDLQRENEHFDAARDLFTQVLGIRQHLVDQFPDDVEKAVGLSQIHVRLGDVSADLAARAAADARAPLMAAAQAQYQQALNSLQFAFSRLPGNVDLERELSWDFLKLSDTALAQQPDAALGSAQNALCLRRHLANLDQANPAISEQTNTSLRDVTYSLDRVGGAKLRLGDRSGAEAAFSQALGLRRYLATKDFGDDLFLSDVAASEMALAKLKGPSALAFAEAALAIRKQLVDRAGSTQKDQDAEKQSNELVLSLCPRADKTSCFQDTDWQPVVANAAEQGYESFLATSGAGDTCLPAIIAKFARTAASQ